MSFVQRAVNYFFGEAEAAPKRAEELEIKHEDLELKETQKEEIKIAVCKFFLEGKCRFGEKCRNKHPPKMAPAQAETKSKKCTKIEVPFKILRY